MDRQDVKDRAKTWVDNGYYGPVQMFVGDARNLVKILLAELVQEEQARASLQLKNVALVAAVKMAESEARDLSAKLSFLAQELFMIGQDNEVKEESK